MIAAASGAFFYALLKNSEKQTKTVLLPLRSPLVLELIRELPQVVQLHVLIVPQLLAGGVADQLNLIFLAAGGALDSVADTLYSRGYTLTTGIQVKRDGIKGNGFAIAANAEGS